MNNNDIVLVNETHFRVILDEDYKKNQPWYICECGTTIKLEHNLEKHTNTISHAQNLINRHYFAVPKQSLLRPNAK